MSETIKEYHSNVDSLKSSEIWRRKSSESFRKWIEKTWLPLDKACLKQFAFYCFIYYLQIIHTFQNLVTQ